MENNLNESELSKAYLAKCLRRLKEWGAPLEDWRCVDLIDMCEGDDEDTSPTFAKCDLCDCHKVRFVHVMDHPLYLEEVRVGCICAGIMEGDVLAAKERERLMNLGMNEYISKPIDENILVKLLENSSSLEKIEREHVDKTDDDFLSEKYPQIRDAELALKHVSGKKDLAREMLEMFMESVVPTQDAISKAGSLTSEQLVKVVHKMAGGAAYSGMVKIQKICNIIEASLRNGAKIQDIEPELYELDDLLEIAKKQAPEWLKQLE